MENAEQRVWEAPAGVFWALALTATVFWGAAWASGGWSVFAAGWRLFAQIAVPVGFLAAAVGAWKQW